MEIMCISIVKTILYKKNEEMRDILPKGQALPFWCFSPLCSPFVK